MKISQTQILSPVDPTNHVKGFNWENQHFKKEEEEELFTAV